jgi:hypothetical protein
MDWSGGNLTPAGKGGHWRPRRRFQRRGGSRTSPRKASSRSGNPRVTTKNNKLYENSLKKQALQIVFLSKISSHRKILQYK